MDIDLRDRFAISALQSLIEIGGSFFESGRVLADNLAKNAYKIADAMMRARSRPPVLEPVPVPIPVGGQIPHRCISRKSSKPKATKEILEEIIAMKRGGFTNKQIADKFGINGQSVNGVLAIARHKGRLVSKAPGGA